jgi:hypothetical protein
MFVKRSQVEFVAVIGDEDISLDDEQTRKALDKAAKSTPKDAPPKQIPDKKIEEN